MISMSGRPLLVLYLLSLATVSFGAIVPFHYDWPDFVHTDYGFPVVWATHTTITFAGPVNSWSVNVLNLIVNITVWMSVSFFGFHAFALIARRLRSDSKLSP